MFAWIAVWLGPFVVMIPINISIHLQFPVQKGRAAWVILMVGKKGDTNGLQGVNGTELNTVTEVNCVTLAGQPQEEHISSYWIGQSCFGPSLK